MKSMQNISNAMELNNAIQLLEEEQDQKGAVLKEQFYLTYESLKPINLLNSTLQDISSSPLLLENIIGTLSGLLSGFLSRKLLVGSSGNLLRKLMGSALQFGVTNVVSRHPETVISFIQFIVQMIRRKRDSKTEESE